MRLKGFARHAHAVQIVVTSPCPIARSLSCASHPRSIPHPLHSGHDIITPPLSWSPPPPPFHIGPFCSAPRILGSGRSPASGLLPRFHVCPSDYKVYRGTFINSSYEYIPFYPFGLSLFDCRSTTRPISDNRQRNETERNGRATQPRLNRA